MVEAIRTRTGPGTDWAAELERLERERFGREPERVRRLRRTALERFLALGYPTRRDEAWRYTDVAPIARTPFVTGTGRPPGRLDEAALERLLLPGAIPLVFVDGTYVGGLSIARTPAGLEVSSLAAALADPAGEELPLGTVLDPHDRPFAALNTALFGDGALVRVARGTVVEEPVQLVFVSTGGPPRATHPRVLVLLEEAAQVSLVETSSGSSGAGLTNAVTELRLGPGALLDHYRVQEEAAEAHHLAAIEARLERDASLRSHLFALGAGLSRTETGVVFGGKGGSAVLNGLYVADGARHAECRTSVDHAEPLCTSRQAYRGILDDSARGVFDGAVRVREGAWRTDAGQENRNLLLSRDARADTKPQLEILADDVRCSHGATIGQLEEEPIFYLRSRGIAEPAARAILTLAFAQAVARGIRPDALRARVQGILHERLAKRTAVPPVEEGPRR